MSSVYKDKDLTCIKKRYCQSLVILIDLGPKSRIEVRLLMTTRNAKLHLPVLSFYVRDVYVRFSHENFNYITFRKRSQSLCVSST